MKALPKLPRGPVGNAGHEAFGHYARWLPNGAAAYAEMETQIDAAMRSIRLESYLVRPGGPADMLRAALLRAIRRGVSVSVLIDAYGSAELPAGFLAELERQGGRVRVFNPRRLLRLAFRNHRKLLVCDQRSAVIGGFNIGPEYDGDGVTSGWRDLGVLVTGRIAEDLCRSFDDMFELAEFTTAAIRRFRAGRQGTEAGEGVVALLTGGLGSTHPNFRRALRRDLARARSVLIMTAYFLPTARIRRLLRRCVRRGGCVRVILAGRTDVPLAKLAAEHQYASLLRAGVEIHEYQPQVLHGKALIIDDIAYVGSSNLDARSLQINFELMLRFDWPEFAAAGRRLLLDDLDRCRRIEPRFWLEGRNWWRSARSRAAHFLLARVDPLVAQHKLRAIS